MPCISLFGQVGTAMTTDTVIPPLLVSNLYDSYQALTESCLSLRQAIHSDKNEYPVYIPTYGSSEADKGSKQALETAINSMTQLFVSKENTLTVEAGILCAPPSVVSAVKALNECKDTFKQSITDIRAYKKDKEVASKRITNLINDHIAAKGYRSDALKKAMRTVGISSLDLKRCYSKIRIMPERLDVFSWTWATSHSYVKSLTIQEVSKLIDNIPSSKQYTSGIARSILATCNPGEKLARKIPQKNQLRANYAYWENEIKVRKSTPISGVVIAQQKAMPRKLWRNNPALNKQVPRLLRESCIDSEPLIKALNIYRYVN